MLAGLGCPGFGLVGISGPDVPAHTAFVHSLLTWLLLLYRHFTEGVAPVSGRSEIRCCGKWFSLLGGEGGGRRN